VVWWEERAATREDKSLREASRLDVAGGEGLNLRSQEGNRGTKVINHGDELSEKGGHCELTVGEGSGRGIVDSGERSQVETSEPSSVPKNIGDIVSLPGERGMTGLGRRRTGDRSSPRS